MSSIKDALKALCQKLTSQESDKDSIAGVIEDIAEKYTPGEGAAGPQGPAGKDGVGITSITGSIDGENNLTITINLTEGEPQTITGKITPPA